MEISKGVSFHLYLILIFENILLLLNCPIVHIDFGVKIFLTSKNISLVLGGFSLWLFLLLI